MKDKYIHCDRHDISHEPDKWDKEIEEAELDCNKICTVCPYERVIWVDED